MKNPSNKSNRNVLLITSTVAIIMFGFCFAMVPLYSLLCKATGTNTSSRGAMLITPAMADTISKSTDLTREITVQFTATNHMGMPWDFYPRTKAITVHPGEKAKIYFYAKNTTTHDMTVQAIPSMTPPESLGHLHKIECFCFRQQTLKAGESRDMPMVFQIDSDLPKEVRVITLAYTLFDATPLVTRKGKSS
ncbi:MAG: cytochrome c oxidase assembly protein [Gammaproteobacteria bacterium RIFCSPHIGHO2_12_FULL_37_34]|nr:MAG: cytochrome c oxidase assembly protein [Gammaproteobacteria bacterium RIFCSPHIGHO2_12_FULL_37_34]